MKRLLPYAIGFLLVVLVGMLLYADSVTMKTHHCQLNGQTRTAFVITYIYNGQSSTPVSVPTTEYAYTCDDGVRWR